MIEKIKKLVKNNLIILVVLLIPLLAGFNLLKFGYFSMHDDVQVMRLYEMEKCLNDGQIPCRLVPDMGAGYGHPLFNYNTVFPYYSGTIFRILGFSFLYTAKLLFFSSLLFSGLFMYLLAKEFFGKYGGLVASVLYILAPYRAVDIYVRGALTEAFSFIFFPLIFWTLYKYLKTSKIVFFVLSIVSLSGLFLTHNIMTYIFTPVAFIWGVFWLRSLKKTKEDIIKYVLIFVWALGLSAFFVLPSILEMNLARLDLMTINNFTYTNHFVNIAQLFFNTDWGYGSSILGFNDNLSFQIGLPHLILGFVGIGVYFRRKIRNQKPDDFIFVILFLFLFSIFMCLNISEGLWKILPLVSYIQFPWRFLTVIIFTVSLLAGWLVKIYGGKKSVIPITCFIVLATIAFNLGYFKPQVTDSKMTDAVKLSGWEWERQSRTTLEDYVPKTVKLLPISLAPSNPVIISGKGIITEYIRRSDFFRFAVETQGEKGVVVEVPIFDFPIWQVFLNTTITNYSVDPDKGTILVAVNPDKHTVVTGWFRNTPIRRAANAITIVSLGALIVLVIIKSRENENE